MDDLAQWLRVQLDTDEQTARATAWDGSGNKLNWELIASATIDVGGDEFYVGDRTIANHMMTWQPARVLTEIDAKRRIMAEHLPIDPCDAHDASCETVACDTLRLLALPYADRPGYRKEWAP